MSIEQEMSARLEFDLADRMRRALRTSDVGVQEMAEYLGVARTSVSNWINGRIVPSKQTLRLWAIKTGVPFEWLETGEYSTGDNGPDTGINKPAATRHARTRVSEHGFSLAVAA